MTARLDNKSDRRQFIAPSGGVTAGNLYLVEDRVVFATEDADAAAAFSGVHRDHALRGVPKATGAAWAVGDELYWDNSAGKVTKDSTGNKLFAVAISAAASGATTGDCEFLDG